MATLSPYLSFNGNCREAFSLYKSVFKKEFAFVGLYKDMPSEQPIPESEQNKIMHISMPINEYVCLMGSDTSEHCGQKTTFGDNVSISISCDTEEEAKRIFTELSAGGKVIMPLEMQFWGALYALFTDKFGVAWMVSCDCSKKK